MENLTFEGEEYGSPAPFPWYPEGMAYNCTFSRTLVRKSPELASFHTFLVNEAARVCCLPAPSLQLRSIPASDGSYRMAA
jgi:hypothetical protein